MCPLKSSRCPGERCRGDQSARRRFSPLPNLLSPIFSMPELEASRKIIEEYETELENYRWCPPASLKVQVKLLNHCLIGSIFVESTNSLANAARVRRRSRGCGGSWSRVERPCRKSKISTRQRTPPSPAHFEIKSNILLCLTTQQELVAAVKVSSDLQGKLDAATDTISVIERTAN